MTGPRRPARAALLVYAGAVAAESVRAAGRDAPAVAAVFATMHVAWGIGFLRGCATLGVPWRALSGLR